MDLSYLNAGMQLVTFVHKCQGAYLRNNSETEVYCKCVTNIDR